MRITIFHFHANLLRWIKKKELLRQHLYFNRESPFFSDLKVDYSPLLWCAQARDEALQFFCEENHLIRVTLYAKDHEKIIPSAILEPQDQLRVPIELFDDDMLTNLERGVTLRLQIGEGCGDGPATRAKNVVYDRIFVFNKHSWSEYCQTLASNGLNYYKGIIITLHERYRSDFRPLIPDFLLELSYLRNVGRVWLCDGMESKFFNALTNAISENPVWPWQWHDLLIGLLEEARYRNENDSTDAGFIILSRATHIADIAMQHLTAFMQSAIYNATLHLPRVNATYALCAKVFTFYIFSTHQILQIKTRDGTYPPSTFIGIKKMYRAMLQARVWPGMQPKQLSTYMMATGIFHYNVAGFLSSSQTNMEMARNDANLDTNPGTDKTNSKFSLDITEHRRQAAHAIYAAGKIYPTKYETIAVQMWEELYRTHRNGHPREYFIPRLETLSTPTGGEWFGPPEMWDRWGRDGLHHLDKIREVAVVQSSKSQLKKVREQLGMTNCRKDGLIRCLVVWGIE